MCGCLLGLAALAAEVLAEQTAIGIDEHLGRTLPLDLARMLHRVHLSGGNESHFLTLFQSECTHCHKLDMSTGRWGLGSGTETSGQ